MAEVFYCSKIKFLTIYTNSKMSHDSQLGAIWVNFSLAKFSFAEMSD